MKYLSQTEYVVGDKKNGSTMVIPKNRHGIFYSSPEIVFRTNKIQGNRTGKITQPAQEELTKDEEKKFYQKVFKTTLL